jgi:hypothetical protein
MSGQHGNPLRVVAFNTAEHWSEDAEISRARSCGDLISRAKSCPRQSRRLSNVTANRIGS